MFVESTKPSSNETHSTLLEDQNPEIEALGHETKDKINHVFHETCNSDEDKDLITYTATLPDGRDLPEGIKFDPITKAAYRTSLDIDVSSLVVRIIASDDAGTLVFRDIKVPKDAPIGINPNQHTEFPMEEREGDVLEMASHVVFHIFLSIIKFSLDFFRKAGFNRIN